MVPFLTGHMWLIRVGPHGAPDTLKMTTAPQEILYAIFVLFQEKAQRDGSVERKDERCQDKSQNLGQNSWYVLICSNRPRVVLRSDANYSVLE